MVLWRQTLNILVLGFTIHRIWRVQNTNIRSGKNAFSMSWYRVLHKRIKSQITDIRKLMQMPK